VDPFEERAAAIKANPNGYRELSRCVCQCSQRRNTIAILYVGDGGQRWLWMPGGRGPGNQPDQNATGPIIPVHHPARAVPVPRTPGDATYPAPAICPRCRTGLLLLPRVDRIDAMPVGAPTWARVAE
jgi:hypothetical protein